MSLLKIKFSRIEMTFRIWHTRSMRRSLNDGVVPDIFSGDLIFDFYYKQYISIEFWFFTHILNTTIWCVFSLKNKSIHAYYSKMTSFERNGVSNQLWLNCLFNSIFSQRKIKHKSFALLATFRWMHMFDFTKVNNSESVSISLHHLVEFRLSKLPCRLLSYVTWYAWQSIYEGRRRP